MPDGERQPTRRPSTAPATATAQEAMLVCPECGTAHHPRFFEMHLRLVHRIYSFRGVRRSYNDTLAVLLDALTAPKPDAEAWTVLKTLADEEQKERSAYFLTTLLGQRLARLDPERRGPIVDALGQLLVAQRVSAEFVATLATDAESAARHLALAVMAHGNDTLDPSLYQPLRGLILDRRLPFDAQIGAMTTLLHNVGPDSLLAKEFLQKFVGGLGKAKSIERLRQLEERTGKSAAIDSLCADLEDKLRMTCPRCAVQLRKPEMEDHLWNEHRLVLEGRRVREPWNLIEEWAKSLQGKPDAEVMERCRTLALRLDPENGAARLQRLYLSAGVGDEDTRRALLEEARQRHASLCPTCFTLVPVPREAVPVALEQRRGRLYAKGVCVELSDKGWQTTLEVRTPDRIIYQGREPRRYWTMNGARVLLVGTCVLLSLLCACLMPTSYQLALGLTVAYLLTAAIMEAIVRELWKERVPIDDRVFDFTWRYVVPRLHADGYRLDDSAFIAALVRATPAGRGSVVRAPLLQDLVQRTEVAVRDGQGPPEHLAALRRLLIADAVAAGADPVPLVLAQLTRCFEGNLTLSYAEQFLRDWNADWWTAGNRARLRVLLCDRAFEAGFEVADLLDSAETAPSLRTILAIDEPEQLAGLRYLWSLRATRPWDKFGETETIFEIAARAEGAALLVQYPDVLLVQQAMEWRVAGDGGRGRMGPARIYLCLRGVVLQDLLYTSPPNLIELTERKDEFSLVLGKGLFKSHDNLDGLVKRMERWFRYWFNEFLPQTRIALTWHAPNRAAVLRAWGAVLCPECKHYFMARHGEVGVAVDESSGKTA
jgi:hypothetical protein